MSHNILITGASGYLGGTLLARWKAANLPAYNTLYALVRSDQQAQSVKAYGAEPLILDDLGDLETVTRTVVQKEISIIYFLVDAFNAHTQKALIGALGLVKEKTGRDVHFLHTTGAKAFSSHVGMDGANQLLDTDPRLYEIQKTTVSPHPWFTQIARTNTDIIDTAEAAGVRSYIFAPCIVYGEGEGFGNRISIQDVAIVRAAKAAGRVYKVDTDRPVWPVCHIHDNTELYLQILRQILQGKDVGHGKEGFFLAASGSVAWDDIYQAFAKALAKRGVVVTDEVELADESGLEKMGRGLDLRNGTVAIQLGGGCNFTAAHGSRIGWKPQYAPEHILEVADAEVEQILKSL